jgi:hypothetical protein
VPFSAMKKTRASLTFNTSDHGIDTGTHVMQLSGAAVVICAPDEFFVLLEMLMGQLSIVPLE